MSNPLFLVSIDGESNGLHGEVFAIGAVVKRPNRRNEEFYVRCPIAGPYDPWVTDNVLPSLAARGMPIYTHENARSMRDAFWNWLAPLVKVGAIVVADCGWPVEAGLLSACVADDPSRAFGGPYPLHDVATLLLAAGLDPMAEYAPKLLDDLDIASYRKHDPVWDAEVSARCAIHALDIVGASLAALAAAREYVAADLDATHRAGLPEPDNKARTARHLRYHAAFDALRALTHDRGVAPRTAGSVGSVAAMRCEQHGCDVPCCHCASIVARST